MFLTLTSRPSRRRISPTGGLYQAANGDVGVAVPLNPGGRLTISTGTPIITSTVTAATTVYYTPHIHRFVPLYDGARFVETDIGGELSQATTDTTKSPAACTTNSNYDLFVWNDNGTFRCTRGPAWSSDTSRGTGAGTTQISQVLGAYVNTVAITNGPAANRGTYVGTIRTNGSSQVDMNLGAVAAGGTAGFIGVWNAFNRVATSCTVGDTTDSWNYASATVRPSDNSTGMRVSFVSGLAIEQTIVVFTQPCLPQAGVVNASAGFGLDSTSAYSKYATAGGSAVAGITCFGYVSPQIGFHYLQALEACSTAATVTFYGDAGGSSNIQNFFVCGIMA